jgi:hypothetical protein
LKDGFERIPYMYLFKCVGYKFFKYAWRNKKIEKHVIIPKTFPSPQNP